ncbi:exonuclease domain-containing protein [Ditylenchus destructor]|uniref:Probable oligoribonuclease n=1 Tax=Ditylenchus destructor TaxID=166010 RepID=A0AAD4QV22_9BILA|nr:exonuclease domain-containing protein [Ditylenchus destructor]
MFDPTSSDTAQHSGEYRDRRFNGTDEEREQLLSTSTTLWVGELSHNTTEEQIIELFSRAGPIHRVIMGLHRDDHTPCGFCFVEYENRSGAENAMRDRESYVLDGQKLTLSWDTGFTEGRQFGRGRHGGQKSEDKKKPWSKDKIVWVDCEMTGLDVAENRILEIACIITDSNLEVIAELGPICIKHPPEVMKNMSDWCRENFPKNGLLERVEKDGIPEHEAESQVLEFIKQNEVPEKRCPLAGNNVFTDRGFLKKHMPKVTDYLNYHRIIDVSSINELVKRWYPAEVLEKIPRKERKHMAMDDIRESIMELKYYREHFFKTPPQANGHV